MYIKKECARRNSYVLLLTIILLWVCTKLNAQKIHIITFDKSGKIISGLPEKLVDGDELIFRVIGYNPSKTIKRFTDSINNKNQKSISSAWGKKNNTEALLGLFNINPGFETYQIPPFFMNTGDTVIEEYKIQIDGMMLNVNCNWRDSIYNVKIDENFYVGHASHYKGALTLNGKTIVYIGKDNKFNFTLIRENNLSEKLIAYYRQHIVDWDSTSIKLDTVSFKGSLVLSSNITNDLKKYSNNMADFYIKHPIPELATIATEIKNNSSFHANLLTSWIKDWIWFTGIPTFNPFSFHNPTDFKDIDTNEVPSMRIELAALTRRIMRLKGNNDIKEMKKEYDSLDIVIDSLEQMIIKIKKRFNDQKTAQQKNEQAMKDFTTTKTILNQAFLYCTDEDYEDGYKTPIYWMRNHNAANNAALMNGQGKSEYLETDKVVFLGHNLLTNQNLILNSTVTPISSQNSQWTDGIISLFGGASTVNPSTQFTSAGLEKSNTQELLYTGSHNDSLITLKEYSSGLSLKLESLINKYSLFNKRLDTLKYAFDSLNSLQKIIQTPGYVDSQKILNIEWQEIAEKRITLTDQWNQLKGNINTILSDHSRFDTDINSSAGTHNLSGFSDRLLSLGNQINTLESNSFFVLLKSLKGPAIKFQESVKKECAAANEVLNDLQIITGLPAYIKFIQSQHTPYTKLQTGKVDTVYHTTLINSNVIATVSTPNIVSYTFTNTVTNNVSPDTSNNSKKTGQTSNNASPGSTTKAMPAISNVYKIDKLYRILPFVGVAYCTTQFTNLTLNTAGNAPVKLTIVNQLSTVVGLKFYLQKTNIRSDKFFTQQSDGGRCLFLSRTSIDIGVGIPNPINNLYGGIGFDLIPGININFGALLQGYPTYSFLNTQYMVETDTYRGSFYIGISTDASAVFQIAKLLNLTK